MIKMLLFNHDVKKVICCSHGVVISVWLAGSVFKEISVKDQKSLKGLCHGQTILIFQRNVLRKVGCCSLKFDHSSIGISMTMTLSQCFIQKCYSGGPNSAQQLLRKVHQ